MLCPKGINKADGHQFYGRRGGELRLPREIMYLGPKTHLSPNDKWARRRYLLRYNVLQVLRETRVQTRFCYRRREDFEDAFALLYQRYYGAGLIPENSARLYLTPYQALPKSRICVARSRETGEIMSTATLVLDSELGLPSDFIYKEEIDILRREGRRLAEFTCLAAKNNYSPFHHHNGLFYVFRLLYRYAVSMGVTDIVISINRKHSFFYEKILLFRPLGPEKVYHKLQNAPAVLEHLDLTTAKERFRKAYEDFEEGQAFYSFFAERGQLNDLFELIKPVNMSASIFQEFYIYRTNLWETMELPFKKFFGRYFFGSEFDQRFSPAMVSNF